jgi:preprotein translocase subunit SecE
MATRAVKMNDESPSGSNLPLVNKVTDSVQETRQFLHDVRVEMKQVTWPNREDVISTTGVVIATVAFFGVFLAIVEWLAQKGLDQLLHYFHV